MKYVVDTQKIREDYGSVRHFCRKVGINYNTLYVLKGGKWNSSEKLKRKLKELGYLREV